MNSWHYAIIGGILGVVAGYAGRNTIATWPVYSTVYNSTSGGGS